MAKNLLIVESPAKAKTIEKILGEDFEVKSCFGHIRDLEKDEMGIDVKNNFNILSGRSSAIGFAAAFCWWWGAPNGPPSRSTWHRISKRLRNNQKYTDLRIHPQPSSSLANGLWPTSSAGARQSTGVRPRRNSSCCRCRASADSSGRRLSRKYNKHKILKRISV